MGVLGEAVLEWLTGGLYTADGESSSPGLELHLDELGTAPPMVLDLGLGGSSGVTVAGGTGKELAPELRGQAEPIGWLGYLLAHGAACLAFSKAYQDKHQHLLPDLAGTWHSGDAGNEFHDDFHRGTLLVNRFAEWPCPAIVRGGPRFLAPVGTDQLFGARRAELNSTIQDFAIYQGSSWIAHGFGPRPAIWWDLDAGEGAIDVHADGTVWHREWGKHTAIRPAANVSAYIMTILTANYRAKNKQLVLGPPLLAPLAGRQLICPPAWRAESKRRRWWRRLVRWYYTAAWLVWCGEMLRLHCPSSRAKPAPAWWLAHCVCWGIGVPTLNQVQARKTYDDEQPRLEVKEMSSPSGPRPVTAELVESILRLVVAHTPIPGTAGATGEQIAADGVAESGRALHKRALCDIPPQAGSVAPPINLTAWLPASAQVWASGQNLATWHDAIAVPILNAWVGVIGGMVGAGAASSIGSTLASSIGQVGAGVVMKVATAVLQRGWELVKSQDPDFKISWSDVAGLVGQVVSSVGVGEGTLLKGVPPELWQQLKTAGAQLTAFGDWSQQAGTLYQVQNAMTAVRDFYGWDYLDQAWGGLGLSQKAKAFDEQDA